MHLRWFLHVTLIISPLCKTQNTYVKIHRKYSRIKIRSLHRKCSVFAFGGTSATSIPQNYQKHRIVNPGARRRGAHYYVPDGTPDNGVTVLRATYDSLIQWHTFSGISGILSAILLSSGEICKIGKCLARWKSWRLSTSVSISVVNKIICEKVENVVRQFNPFTKDLFIARVCKETLDKCSLTGESIYICNLYREALRFYANYKLYYNKQACGA